MTSDGCDPRVTAARRVFPLKSKLSVVRAEMQPRIGVILIKFSHKEIANMLIMESTTVKSPRVHMPSSRLTEE